MRKSIKGFAVAMMVLLSSFMFVACGKEKVSAVLTNITLLGDIKTTYFVDEKLSVEDVFVVLHYADMTTQKTELTESMVSGFETSEVGDYTFTVTYSGMSVNVSYVVVESLETSLKLADFLTECESYLDLQKYYYEDTQLMNGIESISKGWFQLDANREIAYGYDERIQDATNFYSTRYLIDEEDGFNIYCDMYFGATQMKSKMQNNDSKSSKTENYLFLIDLFKNNLFDAENVIITKTEYANYVLYNSSILSVDDENMQSLQLEMKIYNGELNYLTLSGNRIPDLKKPENVVAMNCTYKTLAEDFVIRQIEDKESYIEM